jgi:cation diffusion facilitator CzcD-associated flavoprotein CzcO
MDTAETIVQNKQASDGNIVDTDVLIIGAGISGLGAAQHLQEKCPDKNFLILESKEGHGGTWRQHTYPGIRSDSDLFTFGYKSRPWSGNPIAQADMILDYLDETIAETGIAGQIRYNHQVRKANWSSEDATWTLEVLVTVPKKLPIGAIFC